jgi:Family of unknown function (DUF6878)
MGRDGKGRGGGGEGDDGRRKRGFRGPVQSSKKAHAMSTPAKKPILAALKRFNIAKAVTVYDGEGDSGQIESITATTVDGKDASLDVLFGSQDPQSPTLRDVLDDFAWACLEAYHDGFEINDGGYGDITIDVASGKVLIDHNDRFTDVTNTTTEV